MKKKIKIPKQVVFFAAALFLSIFSFSCKKDQPSLDQAPATGKVDPDLVYRLPKTEIEKSLVLNLVKITEVIKEVYKDEEALKVVNVAIQAKIYSDNSILLKDLIYPKEGLLLNSIKFQKIKREQNLNEQKFADSFWKVVFKMNDSELFKFLDSLNPSVSNNFLTSNTTNNKKYASLDILSANHQDAKIQNFSYYNDQVSIYFPYIEHLIDPVTNVGNYSSSTSLVTAVADADEGLGWAPTNSGNILSYRNVIINDDYAENNSTHIIGINGVRILNSESKTNIGVFPPGPPITVPNLSRIVKQVYVGNVRCKKQYDSFISFTGNGGGSEIRFTRSDGFLKVSDGQVQADHFIVQGRDDFSRYNIRKGKWLDWTVEWDSDWESDNLEQNLAIYEEDNRNTSTFNTSLSTKIKILGTEATGSIGVSINYKSDDALIRQQNHKYVTFFALNRGYAGEETSSGWLIYDKNSPVSFTLPDRTLIP